MDYSHGIGVDAMNWISKPPGKLPPSTNIVRTFDYYSWVMIAFSLIAVWYLHIAEAEVYFVMMIYILVSLVS